MEPEPTANGRALEARRARVLAQLEADPALRVAADAADAPLMAEAGPPVSVMLAVRTLAGIVSGELHIPRERWDAALFFETLRQTSENPS